MNSEKRNSFKNMNQNNQNTSKIRDGGFKILRNEKIGGVENNADKGSEKEFYENIRKAIENTPDNLEKVSLESFKIIIKRNFSAYQLFKILLSSKSKIKFKYIQENEEDFYHSFWEVMKNQKPSNQVEGLKLLRFFTSDNLLTMSQEAQAGLLRQLKQFSSFKNKEKNANVICFSFYCIGNILTNTTFKLSDENNEILLNIYEFIKDSNSLSQLEDPSTPRILAASIRVLSCLYIDLKLLPSQIGEFLISQMIRYIYFGTSFFPLQKTNISHFSDVSSDSAVATSSSEISDTDESIEKKKEDETCIKIRNYSAICLANIFRQNPKTISQYIHTLFPCKVLRKETTKLIHSFEKPLILIEEFSDKRNKRATSLAELKIDFNEPTLLNILLFEENAKVKISICKAIVSILDGYQGDKLLLTIDGEKLEKTKIEPYKSISHQIYQIFKNLTLAVTSVTLLETDETLLNHFLRLASTMLSHPSYEKVGHLTVQTFLKNILIKLLPKYSSHSIYLSCVSCFGALASENIRHKEFQKLAFNLDFNIIGVLLDHIKFSMDNVNLHEAKIQKHERVPQNTILLESIIALSKFPKHYVEHILEYTDQIFEIVEKIFGLDKKYMNFSLRIMEETIKNINNSQDESENVEPDQETAKTINLIDSNLETKINSFHNYVSRCLKTIFTTQSDNLEHILNILYYLEEKDWNNHYAEIKGKLLSILSNFNKNSPIKQHFLKLLGKVCIFPSFVAEKDFSKIVFQILQICSQEKNNLTVIKNSWVLANFCANFKHFDQFSISENQEILLMSLGYCNSVKEKLISNGFRALGYYIRNNTDEILSETINKENSQASQIKESLKDVYNKPFAQCSVKVCWNVCVSLSNILKSFHEKFMQAVFNESILENISKILTAKNNFKTQLHCIEMLTLAYTKFPQSECFAALMETLVLIYFAPEEGEYSISEVRHIPQLRNEISDLFVKLLKNIDLDKSAKCLIHLLNVIPQKVSQLLFEVLEKSYKEQREKLIEENWKGDEENKSPTITSKNDLLNFDEVLVKGTLSHKAIIIPVQKLSSPDLQSLKVCLEDLKLVGQRLTSFIDVSDEVAVPFSIYNRFKQLADLDLNSEEGQITFDLEQIQIHSMD